MQRNDIKRGLIRVTDKQGIVEFAVIRAADERGITMVFTGVRHFKH